MITQYWQLEMLNSKCTKSSNVSCPSSNPLLPHPLPIFWSQGTLHSSALHPFKKAWNCQQTAMQKLCSQDNPVLATWNQMLKCACSTSKYTKPSHISCPSSYTRPCLTHFPTFDLRDNDSSPLYRSKTCSHTSPPKINQNHPQTSMQKLCRCDSFCSKSNAPLQMHKNLHTLPALAHTHPCLTHFPTFDLKDISLHATP